jgi:arabinofuranosyltransferase
MVGELVGELVKGAKLVAPRTLFTLLFVGYALIAYRTAWLSDDAMITLRTSSNWLAGYGLTWNIAERVQTYTHPLWMLLLTGAHALTGEPFYSTLYLSLATSCAAVFVLCGLSGGGSFERVIALVALAMSKAFMDFSSSGLENPLTHLWLALFVRAALSRDASSLPLYALAGLGAVIRFDVVLLCAPAVFLQLTRERPKRAVLGVVAASLPALSWLVFSVLYYGFPWPNTAYAKLGVGTVVADGRLQAGLDYLALSLRQDPLTLVAILSIAVLVFARGDRMRRALVAGALLYLLYVLRIGGDFMTGRFLSAPFFLCVACLATSDELLSKYSRPLALAVALALPWLGQTPPAFTDDDFGAGYVMLAHEAHDERAAFFPVSSLTHAARSTPNRPNHAWARAGHALRREARDRAQRVRVVDAIGYAGYYAGPDVHIVDHWALADPLLARMPAIEGKLGHFTRAIPDGYLETLATSKNVIREPSFAAYYAQLALVVRGSLWSMARMRAIWKLNTGALEGLITRSAYLRARSFEVRLEVENPTDHPLVLVHAWNDGRRSAYVLDDRSQRGKRYALRLSIDAKGARVVPGSLEPSTLLGGELPAPHRIEHFEGLRARGLLSLSTIFSSLEPAASDIYDLRFGYRIDGESIQLVRQPSPHTALDFPHRGWISGPLGNVLRAHWSQGHRAR